MKSSFQAASLQDKYGQTSGIRTPGSSTPTHQSSATSSQVTSVSLISALGSGSAAINKGDQTHLSPRLFLALKLGGLSQPCPSAFSHAGVAPAPLAAAAALVSPQHELERGEQNRGINPPRLCHHSRRRNPAGIRGRKAKTSEGRTWAQPGQGFGSQMEVAHSNHGSGSSSSPRPRAHASQRRQTDMWAISPEGRGWWMTWLPTPTLPLP